MSFGEHKISSSDNRIIPGQKRKRTRQESTALREDWTAARCNRLLRTISSRISTLRRILNTEGQADAGRRPVKPKVLPRTGNKAAETDPAWLPNGSRKNSTRTYSGRTKAAKTQSQPKTGPDNLSSLAFPSPFVRRLANSSSFGSESLAQEAEDEPYDIPQHRRSRQLPIKPKSHLQEAENGLVSALSSLLHQTKAPGAGGPRNGARSLMSACLRKIPAYIELESATLEEDEDTEDPASDILSYLEDLGPSHNSGWPGLREVVRGQSIHLICRAIEDDLLSEGTVRRLEMLCSRSATSAEGHQIIQTWLESRETPTIVQMWLKTEACHESAKMRICAYLLDAEPANILRISQSSSLWNEVLGLLMQGTDSGASNLLISCANSSRLLEDQESITPKVLSATKAVIMKTTVMGAAALLLGGSTSEAPMLHDSVHRIAADAAFDCLENPSRKHSDLSSFFMMCSMLLLGIGERDRRTYGALNFCGLATLLDPAKKGRARSSVCLRNQQESFAAAFAEGITDLEKRLELVLLERLLDRVLENDRNEALLRQVAIQTLSVARGSNGMADDEALRGYLRRCTASGDQDDSPIPRTPFSSKQTPSRFRWEEGLCEWVTSTPLPTKALHRQYSESEQEVDEPDSPKERIRSPQVIIKHRFQDSESPTAPQSHSTEDDQEAEGLATPLAGLDSPRVIIRHPSPDILSLSVKPRRVTFEAPGWKVSKRARTSEEPQPKRPKSKRISNEESGDELGF